MILIRLNNYDPKRFLSLSKQTFEEIYLKLRRLYIQRTEVKILFLFKLVKRCNYTLHLYSLIKILQSTL